MKENILVLSPLLRSPIIINDLIYHYNNSNDISFIIDIYGEFYGILEQHYPDVFKNTQVIEISKIHSQKPLEILDNTKIVLFKSTIIEDFEDIYTLKTFDYIWNYLTKNNLYSRIYIVHLEPLIRSNIIPYFKNSSYYGINITAGISYMDHFEENEDTLEILKYFDRFRVLHIVTSNDLSILEKIFKINQPLLREITRKDYDYEFKTLENTNEVVDGTIISYPYKYLPEGKNI